jgi:phosphoribulokinase
VKFHSSLRDSQIQGDLFVAFTLEKQVDHIILAQTKITHFSHLSAQINELSRVWNGHYISLYKLTIR